MKPTVLLISCEHGSNKVPAKYMHLFGEKKLLLKTPQAYEVGALKIAEFIQDKLNCDLVTAKVSRLLIDCDHGLHHRNCFSKYSKKLSLEEKGELIDTYYHPYHNTIKKKIIAHIEKEQQVLHLSIHTFQPILKRILLNTAVGVLYHPHRHAEKEVSRIIHSLLLQQTPSYKTRMNYPFSGKNDFVLQSFRKQFEEKDYLGIKLDINQALLSSDAELEQMSDVLVQVFKELLQVL